jgi:hypothetical protein
MVQRALGLFVLLSVACGPTEEEVEPNCGLDLTCVDGEFCLGVIPAGGATGDEAYSCEALPDGCDSFEAMCIDDPACVPDWAAEFCPDAASVACYVDPNEAICND